MKKWYVFVMIVPALYGLESLSMDMPHDAHAAQSQSIVVDPSNGDIVVVDSPITQQPLDVEQGFRQRKSDSASAISVQQNVDQLFPPRLAAQYKSKSQEEGPFYQPGHPKEHADGCCCDFCLRADSCIMCCLGGGFAGLVIATLRAIFSANNVESKDL